MTLAGQFVQYSRNNRYNETGAGPTGVTLHKLAIISHKKAFAAHPVHIIIKQGVFKVHFRKHQPASLGVSL